MAAKAEEQTSVLSEQQGGAEIPYLTPRMLQRVWKTALINRLHCGMKHLSEALLVLTAQRRGSQRLFQGVFQYTEMKLLSAARAATNTSLYSTRVQYI